MGVAKYEVSESVLARLNRDFAHHAPHGDQVARHAAVRYELRMLALRLVRLCPPSEEMNIALTSLQEAMFWSTAAIARNEAPPQNVEPAAAAATSTCPDPVEVTIAPLPDEFFRSATGNGIDGIVQFESVDGKVLGYVVGADQTWFAFLAGPEGTRPLGKFPSAAAGTVAGVKAVAKV